MKTFVLYHFSIVCCIWVLLVSCHKGNPDIPGEPEAKFTIAPIPGGCSDIIVGGYFSNGEAISGADSIQVKVNVLQTGAWNYHTDTINGISFSGSGIINHTGLQYISVVPKGIPVLPGNFLYNIKTDTSKINLYVSVIDKNVIPEPVPGDTPYFKLTIDNISYRVTSGNNDPSRQVGMYGPSIDSGGVGCGIGPDIHPYPPEQALFLFKNNILVQPILLSPMLISRPFFNQTPIGMRSKNVKE